MQNVDIDISELFLEDQTSTVAVNPVNEQGTTQETSASPLLPKRVVEFLSQMSVNAELDKLNRRPDHEEEEEEKQAVASSDTTPIISSLDESLALSIEPNLLDEEWINSFLAGGEAGGGGRGEVEQQPTTTTTTINNDPMFSTLNSNNSVVLADSPSQFDGATRDVAAVSHLPLFPANASFGFASLFNNTGNFYHRFFSHLSDHT